MNFIFKTKRRKYYDIFIDNSKEEVDDDFINLENQIGDLNNNENQEIDVEPITEINIGEEIIYINLENENLLNKKESPKNQLKSIDYSTSLYNDMKGQKLFSKITHLILEIELKLCSSNDIIQYLLQQNALKPFFDLLLQFKTNQNEGKRNFLIQYISIIQKLIQNKNFNLKLIKFIEVEKIIQEILNHLNSTKIS
ncbi:hypothetical protein M0811_11629 [Anaeramoeba ignava]|uniref:Uncharacterized protein n=1 Tax=Anaeramoeba ignava TaxID=1746090 RepID=A0A9Q0LAH1_ANAIG|nr:hypothetical protein M0811_11629 [Anaeramoeba ignava]